MPWICCACPSPAQGTTTAWAPTKRRRPSFPCSWATNLTGDSGIASKEGKTAVYESQKSTLKIGSHVLPEASRSDTTDRNRTSPFAFTGNKFEFRMVGSASSISCPNVVLNTIVADTLAGFADELEKAEDLDKAIRDLLRRTLREHWRIIFNGNNYAEEWVKEAERRGLCNLKTTVDALPFLVTRENIALFERHGVFHSSELTARHEIYLENYCKTIHIEALTMIDMVKREILPAAIAYQGVLADVIAKKSAISEYVETDTEEKILSRLSGLTSCMYQKLNDLETAALAAHDGADIEETSRVCHDKVFSEMTALRTIVDEVETIVAKPYWPFPTYAEILYSVR